MHKGAQVADSKARGNRVIMTAYIGSFVAAIVWLFRRVPYVHSQQPVLAITALLFFVSGHKELRR
jgi:hypothetical protein